MRVVRCVLWWMASIGVLGVNLQSLWAQEAPLKFERLGLAQGLVNPTVYDILQDRTGYLWLATEGGLVKYDGYTFTTYQYDPSNPQSLSTNLVTALYEDHVGFLWVGTNQGGINRFDPRTEQFTRFAATQPESWISDFGEASDGTLYAFASLSVDAISAFNRAAQRFEPVPLDLQVMPPELTRFAIDVQGGMWALHKQQGLYKFNPATQAVQHYTSPPAQPIYARFAHGPHGIVQGSGGAVWLGTETGSLLRLEPETGHVNEHRVLQDNNSHQALYCALMDRQGMLWGTLSGEGLIVYHPHAGTSQQYSYQPNNPYSLSGNTVKSVLEDRSGIIWIGTLHNGLNKVLPHQRQFQHFYHNPDANSSVAPGRVIGFYENTHGDILLATTAGGIQRFSSRWSAFETLPMPPISGEQPIIKAIHEDRLGQLWLGGWGSGLFRQTPDGTFRHYTTDSENAANISADAMRVIYEDRAGTLWVGTEAGLDRYNLQTDTFDHFRHRTNDTTSLGSSTIWALHEDSQGRFWVGTYAGGLNLLNRRTGHAQRFQHNPYDTTSISSNNVASLLEDAAGNLWVGTHGGGLNRLDARTQTFERFTVHDGLPDNHIHSLLEDAHGHLWMSTNNGLARLDPATGIIKTYAANDGLQGRTFSVGSALRRSDGALLFGGTNGFNLFFPDSISVNQQPPPLAFSTFQVGEQKISLDTLLASQGRLAIPYAGNTFAFETVALDFTAPEHNHYAHKLEGFDDGWVETGTRRFASYTNLDPGHYTLHVKGANSDGIWNEAGLSVPIYIVPPVWMRGWFRALMTLLVLLGVGATVRIVSTRALRRRVQALELEQQVQHERQRISRDLHDHVGAQLTYIISSLDLQARRSTTDQQDALRTLGHHARTTMQQLRQTIWALRHEAISVGAFADQIRTYAQQQLRSHPTMRLQVHHTGNTSHELSPSQALNLFRIVQEAITNALKHAHAETLTIDVSHHDGVTDIRVMDDGMGFLLDQTVAEGCGLANMRHRAQSMGAAFAIRSAPHAGTTVTVRLDPSSAL